MRRVLQKIGLTFFIITLFIFFSCEEKKMIVGQVENFEIQNVTIPEVINTDSPFLTRIYAKVTHPEGSDGIEEVMLFLKAQSNSEDISFLMYDDGNADENKRSGDIVAFDQVYTVAIIGTELGISKGNFSAKIIAKSNEGNQLESLEQNLFVFPNRAPAITDFSIPDTIPSGVPSLSLSFTVEDENGIEDILWVTIRSIPTNEDLRIMRDTIPNPQNGSNVFNLTIDSTFGVGRLGNYRMECYAEDRVGEKSEIVELTIYVKNHPPILWGAGVPDTLEIPVGYLAEIFMTVNADDPQGLADIDSVYYNYYLPDNQYSLKNPFVMYDNGLEFDPNHLGFAGDLVAGDGQYSITMTTSLNPTAGTYRLEFFARDKVNNLVEGQIKFFEIIR